LTARNKARPYEWMSK